MDLLLSLALVLSLGILVDGSSDCGACFNHPDFTSSYTILQAQTDQSEATIQHNLNEVPMKVDIQVRFLNSTEPYVFPGLGSAQRDDDQSGTYGGVVYKYNNMSVILYVPNKNDGSSSGTVIYTGDNAWFGPSQHSEDRAEVRVRAWSHCNFPTPQFDSQWIAMAANNGTDSFREIQHGIGVYPEYVSVQIKDKNSDWYSDGIGSSMTVGNIDQNSSWGGVIYGFNDSHVRIWVPGNGSGSLYSTADGWGKGSTEVWNEGYIRVRVWGHFPGVPIYKTTRQLPPNMSARRSRHHISKRSGGSMDIDTGMIYVTVKAVDGLNKGYSFPGMGAVQNSDLGDSFGGLVYGYGPRQLPIWMYHRNSTAQGYIIYINQNWGGGMMPQKSKNATLVVRFWEPYSGTCPSSPVTHALQTHTDNRNSQLTLSHTATPHVNYTSAQTNGGPDKSSADTTVTPEGTTDAGPTTRADIICEDNRISIHVPADLLPTGREVTWNDPSCVVTNNGTHLVGTIGLDSCGTVVHFNDTHVAFENDLVSESTNGTNAIDFGLNSVIPVQCVYPRRQEVSTSFLPVAGHARFYEKGMGHLQVQMRHARDVTFDETYDVGPVAHQVILNKPVYLKLTLGVVNQTISDISINVDRCFATPSSSLLDSELQELTDNGCPASPSVMVYPSPGSEVHFSFRAFRFTGHPNNPVYVHCQVFVCSTSNSDCIPGCNNNGRKRRAAVGGPNTHLVSSGPYRLSSDQAAGSSSALVAVTGLCVFLAVAATVFGVLAWRGRKRLAVHYKEFT